MPKPLHAPHYQSFLRLLREVREQRKMTQAELAKAIGEDQTFVSKCETGLRRLDVLELRTWLLALGSNLPVFAASLEELLATQLSEAIQAPRAPRDL